MVFHFIGNLLNPNNYFYDSQSSVQDLVAEGFTSQEAEQLLWLQSHRNRGKYYGIAAGLFTVYTCSNLGKYYSKIYFPRLVYQPVANFLAKAGVVYLHYLAFDYLYTSFRYASNNKFTNFTIFSNRVYQDSKLSLVQNFEPLNRKFTNKEVEQFLIKGESTSELKGERNFIYNPNIHGENESEWKKDVNTLYEQKIRASKLLSVQEQIKQENQDKINGGETVVFEPFQVLKHVDKTGVQHNLFKFFIGSRSQPIV